MPAKIANSTPLHCRVDPHVPIYLGPPVSRCPLAPGVGSPVRATCRRNPTRQVVPDPMGHNYTGPPNHSQELFPILVAGALWDESGRVTK